MRVLYVNHTAQISGGERSLLELLAALDGRVEPVVAAPEGELADAVRALGVPLRTIPGTAGSLKLHPVHTPRTVAELAHAAWSVRAIAHRTRADLLHANSIRAGLVTAGASAAGGPPALVHVRDVLPDGAVTRATRTLVTRGAHAVIGNSQYTLDRFAPRGGHVAHSPIAVEPLRHAAEAITVAEARHRIGLPDGAGPVLGVVAQLTPWKAQDDAVRILAGVRERFPDAQLVLVGSAKFVSRQTRHDNHAFVDDLHALIAHHGLEAHVHLLGERADVPEVLRALDLLLLPSWEEPFGRAVVEALAVGVPVAATDAGGPPEIIRDGIDGRLLPPRSPDTWVRELLPLLGDPTALRAMGLQGRDRAEAFDRRAHAERVTRIYQEILER